MAIVSGPAPRTIEDAAAACAATAANTQPHTRHAALRWRRIAAAVAVWSGHLPTAVLWPRQALAFGQASARGVSSRSFKRVCDVRWEA